jgi:hypothetical protein
VDVAITLHTDSPMRPTLRLAHRVLEKRRVPHLARIGGVLPFQDDVRRGATRDLYVTTVEPSGETGARAVPRPRCDLPYLEIAYVTTSNSDPTEDGSIVRTHRDLLRATEDPPEGTTVGEVSVEDPWNTGRVETTHVILQVRRGERDAVAARASPFRSGASASNAP